VLACAATLGTVILTRLVWVFPARFLLVRPHADPQTGEHPSWGYTTVLGWAGMRGVVTLAAAFVIPVTFPERDLLILIALVVTAGTLFLQGLTLPWLVRRLRLPGPDPREDALARAALFQEASSAGRTWLDENAADDDPYGAQAAVRERAERRDLAAWERLGDANPGVETPSEAYSRLRREMLGAERARVLEVRSTGRVPHEVVEEVLVALDVEESMLDRRDQHDERARVTRATAVTGAAASSVDACEHLAAAGAVALPDELVCASCVAEGRRDWVHLRQCLTCGRVGCCDSSPRRHATAHGRESDHPVIRSVEPGEHWRWCLVDERLG
jgi:CPA1 family monovalent cation:H+ antiporter